MEGEREGQQLREYHHSTQEALEKETHTHRVSCRSDRERERERLAHVGSRERVLEYLLEHETPATATGICEESVLLHTLKYIQYHRDCGI